MVVSSSPICYVIRLAFLGFIRPCLQDGDAAYGVYTVHAQAEKAICSELQQQCCEMEHFVAILGNGLETFGFQPAQAIG